jgi:hypothetical protein
MAESGAFLDACRQARYVKQAMPTIVKIASNRADQTEIPAILNHVAVRTKPPGGRNSKKSV